MNRLRVYFLGKILVRISDRYCAWTGIENDLDVYKLPFNLCLKCRTRVREQEAMAMAAAEKIGIPVPKLIMFGHDGEFGYILMTHVPGRLLNDIHGSLSEHELRTIVQELKTFVDLMRTFESPWGTQICSVNGGSVRGHQIPHGRIGPCEDEVVFHGEYLQYAHPATWEQTDVSFEETLTGTKVLAAMHHHRVVFTHGDLLPHNIMVKNGHISGIIDWEYSGWLPEYWDCTAMLRSRKLDWWWPKFIMSTFGQPYPQEFHSFFQLWMLAEDTFTW